MSGSSYVWMLTAITLLIYIIAQRVTKSRRIKVKKGSYRVVVIINKDLKMGKGKVLSQFGHAIDAMHEMLDEYPALVEAWRNSGSAKVVLKGSQDDITKAYYDAKELGLLFQRVFDAGKTQIRAGSNTCLLIGPSTKDELEPITGHLPLY